MTIEDAFFAASGSGPTVEEAGWIPSPAGPLCVRIHRPASGLALGSVVLCPPLGREALSSYETYRLTAEALAKEGVVAIRLDYANTGDSSGASTGPGLVEAWLASVQAAIVAGQRMTKGPTSVVGMRMGALLAAYALVDAPGVERLVLWDMCMKGRGWLREQRTLLAVGLGIDGFGAVRTEGDEDDARVANEGREELVDIPSWTFDRAEAAGFERLDIGKLPRPLAREIVIISRQERGVDSRILKHFEGEANVSWREAPGQAELLGTTPQAAAVPVIGIGQAVQALVGGLQNVLHEVSALGVTAALIDSARSDGAPSVRVKEEHIRLGPMQLAGVHTQAESARAGAPLIVMLGTATEPHVGPSRAWVELARQWAAVGLSSVRFCVSGVGDSPTRPGQRRSVTYAADALDDVIEAVTALSPGDPANVVLIGLCSGAYGAVEAALTLTARGVCAIALVPGAGADATVDRGRDRRRQAVVQVAPWLSRAAQSRVAWSVARRVPALIWRLADRLNLIPSPARPLHKLARKGVDTLLILGSRDARAYRALAAAELVRLQSTGRLHFEQVLALDHGMIRGGPREQALLLLDRHVREHFLDPLSTGAS